MFPVEAAVLGDPLRFIPDTELQPHGMDPVGKLGERTAQLFLVYMPVSKAAVVRISVSEPAVVHHKKLHAEIRRLLRHLEEFFAGKIKVRSFPVIDKDRSPCVFKSSPAEIVPESPVINMGQLFKTAVAVHHGRFRSPETLSRFQFKGEVLRMDPHQYSRLIKLILLRLGKEIPAVEEGKSITISLRLGCISVRKHDKGIVLMAGGAPQASHRLNAMMNGSSGKLPFHLVFSVKCDPVVVSIGLIQTHGHHTFQENRGGAPVFHAHCPGDQIQILQNTVIKFYTHIFYIVFHGDHQGIRPVPVLRVDGGKPRDPVLSFQDLEAFIAQFQRSGSCLVSHRQGALPVITASKAGILLGKRIQRIGSVVARLIGISGKTVIPSLDQIGIVKNLCFFSVIGMKQNSVLVCLHLIHTGFRTQCK